MNAPEDPALCAEWEMWHRLRRTPELLARVAGSHAGELALQAELRRDYPDDLVRAAISTVELRRRAAEKFSCAAEMWFDRQGFEQSTSEVVARHKARRFSGAVWDLCCGIGSDALALAAHCDVAAVDVNPIACLRTAWNSEAYGRGARVRTECRSAEEIDTGTHLVHLDPDRRARHAGRVVRLEEYVPELSWMQQLTETARGGAIKLSPASNFGGKFPGCEVELISLAGECKEATVWFGELAGSAPFRATVLPAGETLAAAPLDHIADIREPLAYVYDPDPAVVRAGLVDALADQLQLYRLDEAEEYLTGAAPVVSPFVQTFELLAVLPNQMNEVRAYFRRSDFGQLEIKCRHIPIQADVVRRKLSLPGTQAGVLIFARVDGKSRALVCRRAGTQKNSRQTG